jgi:hypothetical protein
MHIMEGVYDTYINAYVHIHAGNIEHSVPARARGTSRHIVVADLNAHQHIKRSSHVTGAVMVS